MRDFGLNYVLTLEREIIIF